MSLSGPDFDTPIVRCTRCGSVGATAHQGWQLLCDACISEELDWYDE